MRACSVLSLLISISLQTFAAPLQKTQDTLESAKSVLPPSNATEWLNQKKFFEENGFLWIKNFFSPEQVHSIEEWCEQIDLASQSILSFMQHDEKNSRLLMQNLPGMLIVVPEATNPLQACRAEDLLSCYPDLHFFLEGPLTSYISTLLDKPYILFKDKINFKWPGGGAFLPHQDFPAYEPFGPRNYVTAMICIDPATLENGCLQIAKNWKQSFVNDPTIDSELLNAGRAVLPYIIGGKGHGSIQPEYVQKLTWMTLETSPGDLVIFNSYLPHYSETNQSTQSRRAMFLTHNPLEEGDHRKAYYYAKRNDPQNPLFHIGTPTNARSK